MRAATVNRRLADDDLARPAPATVNRRLADDGPPGRPAEQAGQAATHAGQVGQNAMHSLGWGNLVSPRRHSAHPATDAPAICLIEAQAHAVCARPAVAE